MHFVSDFISCSGYFIILAKLKTHKTTVNMKNANQPENNKLSELSIEELTKEEKKRSAAHISFCIILGILVAACIYVTIKKGFNGITPLPLAFFPLYLIIRNSWQSVRKEIRSRKPN